MVQSEFCESCLLEVLELAGLCHPRTCLAASWGVNEGRSVQDAGFWDSSRTVKTEVLKVVQYTIPQTVL